MGYTNSSLATVKVMSPNHSGQRNHKIDTITIHCMVGQLSAQRCGEIFLPTERQASSNYGIGTDGEIGLYVEEKNRSWCSSSASNDNRAITIEVASDKTYPYAVNNKVYTSLINLCADICRRNNIKSLKWVADKSLIGQTDKQNMTVHRWFTATACPGDYLYERMGDIATKVNAKLGVVTPTKVINVGDIVDFKGNTHYVSANSNVSIACVSGKAKVTRISNGAKHPYHLVKDVSGTSTVYGWVNAADVTSDVGIKIGDKVKLTADATVYGQTKKFSSWVYMCTLFVRDIQGSRIVVSTLKTGAITGAVDIKYLKKV